MTKLFRNPLVWILAGLGLIGLVVCFCEICGLQLGVDIIGDPIRNWQSQSEVQSKGNDLYQRVTAMPPIITAKLYSELPLTPNDGGTMACHSMQGKWQYDTQQSYQVVLGQFTQAFAAIGWHKDQEPFNNGGTETIYSVNPEYGEWVVLTEDPPHEANYQTGFTVEIGVVESRCAGG